MKPNVFITGFPRCGSTFLYNILKQHPKISTSSAKELDYFNHKNVFFAHPNARKQTSKKSLAFYLSNFGSGKIRIDFSIRTAYDHQAFRRIKSELGDVKIIFLIREKKDFLRSLHYLLVNTGEISRISFSNFLKKYKDLIDFYSDFEKHISEARKYFSKILVLNILESDTKKSVDKILNFLNLESFDFDWNVYKNSKSERRKASALQPLRRKLRIYFPQTHSFFRNISRVIT